MSIQRLIDIILAFPTFLLALSLVAVLGTGLRNVIIAVRRHVVPEHRADVRASALSVREQPYVEAARALGVNRTAIMFRHVIPNSLAPVIVMATLLLGGAILSAAGLRLPGGGGAEQPTPEWGGMLGQAQQYIFSAFGADHLSRAMPSSLRSWLSTCSGTASATCLDRASSADPVAGGILGHPEFRPAGHMRGGSTAMTLTAGEQAPTFRLQDQDRGDARPGRAARKEGAALLLNPKDDTHGCTLEAQQFNRLLERFEGEGIAVLGVSADDAGRTSGSARSTGSSSRCCVTWTLRWHRPTALTARRPRTGGPVRASSGHVLDRPGRPDRAGLVQRAARRSPGGGAGPGRALLLTPLTL